ncbi:hypothetical protein BKA70DRAFT_1107956, partial [Coprinopsis sp. MPI-PUGE-AT-0042]
MALDSPVSGEANPFHSPGHVTLSQLRCIRKWSPAFGWLSFLPLNNNIPGLYRGFPLQSLATSSAVIQKVNGEFMAGAYLRRISDKIGPKKRIWLMLRTFIQALLTMAGAIAFWKSRQTDIGTTRAHPAWANVLSFVGLAFISASLGLQ